MLDESFPSSPIRFIERQRQRRRREQIPSKEDSIPYSPRKRALTLPGTDHQEKQQSSCPFFAKLPLEIRRDMYEKVMGASILHLGILNKGLRHWVCQEDGKGNGSGEHGCSFESTDMNLERLPSPEGPKHRNLLPILLTCHQAYSEAVDILYSSNTFSIVHPKTVLSLSSLMLRQHFHVIRSLRFKWPISDISRPLRRKAEYDWTHVWSVLATMQWLHDLRVNLAITGPGQRFAPFDPEILEPLRAVTRPKKFEVRLPFPESYATINTAGMPFCVRYCEESWCDQIETGLIWGCTLIP